MSARLTRKPGALFTGAGSWSMRPRNARALAEHIGRTTWSWLDHLDQLHPRHRIEEMHADQIAAAAPSPSRSCSSGMLDVLVARMASGRIFGSSRAHRPCA